MSQLNYYHWGLLDEREAQGSYEKVSVVAGGVSASVILTEAGEVLVQRTQEQDKCVVAIVLARQANGLSRPQIERMESAWDVALSVAHGDSDSVVLQPMPHHWRFSRSDYQVLDPAVSRTSAGTPNREVRHG